MRYARTLLASLAALALIATACGDDDVTTTDPDSELPVASGGASTNSSDDDPVLEDPVLEDPADDATRDDQPQDLPLGAGPYPIADLVFNIDFGNGTSAEYRLACLGDTATFTGDAGSLSSNAACLALNEAEVRTRLFASGPIDRVCTEIYGGPETAQVTGRIDDTPVSATIDRANGCGINDWDSLLASLLPATT